MHAARAAAGAPNAGLDTGHVRFSFDGLFRLVAVSFLVYSVVVYIYSITGGVCKKDMCAECREQSEWTWPDQGEDGTFYHEHCGPASAAQDADE